MKKCKSCQTEIDSKAKKCPHCQTDQRGWFGRHPILTGILGLVVFFIIFGAIGNGNKNTASTSSTTTTPTNNSPTKSNDKTKDVTPKVGDVTKLGDREFIVNSVKRLKGFGYNTPKKGNEFVIVNVTIRNLGKDEVTYNPYDFKIQDANGAQESYTFATLDDSLNSGTLAPEGKVTGSIPFQVPAEDEAKLIFQPSFWSSQRVVVDLGNK